MVNDIVLGSSLKENLLSINRTQRTLDSTTLRLATGLKVNSALDNPQNFFTAGSLDNRANDLQRLLDGISQDIQTVKEAEIGVTALTKLIEQADSIAQQALELNLQASTEAKVVGDVNLRSAGFVASLAGVNVGDQIVISFRDADTITNFPPLNAVTINATTTVDNLVADINAINIGLTNPAVRASVNKNGQLEIAGLNNNIVNIEFDAAGATPDSVNLALANDLGFGDSAKLLADGFGANEVHLTIIAQRKLTSFQLFVAATDVVAQRSDRISLLEGANNTSLFLGLNSVADIFEIGVNGDARQNIVLDGTQTIQGLIDNINNNANLSGRLQADFIEETGQITIEAIDPEIESIETALTSDGVAFANFGFTHALPLRIGNSDADSIFLGAAGGPTGAQIAQLERDFNAVLTQIDGITEDANYRGINLLKGDNLTSFFNEDRSNFLLIEGVDFTFSGLGFESPRLSTIAGAQLSIDSARQALDTVRNFGQSITNDLSIIQNRRSFAERTINTLKAGADDLTVADQNKEGANLLAAQTRQALAITVLSLVGQQQSAILRIF